jgi:hypothetical protein
MCRGKSGRPIVTYFCNTRYILTRGDRKMQKYENNRPDVSFDSFTELPAKGNYRYQLCQ